MFHFHRTFVWRIRCIALRIQRPRLVPARSNCHKPRTFFRSEIGDVFQHLLGTMTIITQIWPPLLSLASVAVLSVPIWIAQKVAFKSCCRAMQLPKVCRAKSGVSISAYFPATKWSFPAEMKLCKNALNAWGVNQPVRARFGLDVTGLFWKVTHGRRLGSTARKVGYLRFPIWVCGMKHVYATRKFIFALTEKLRYYSSDTDDMVFSSDCK